MNNKGKEMKKYWFICMGGKKGECEPYSFPVPAMLGNDAYVKAELAEEMLEVLKEAHKAINTINAIQPLRYYVLEQKLQSIINKAEEV